MSIIQKSQKSLEYNSVLSELAKLAKTEQSRELCLNLTPFVKREDIEHQICCTKEAKDVLDLSGEIPIDEIQNFSKLKERNEYFIEEELIEIAKTMRTSRLVRSFLKENLSGDSTILNNLVYRLYSNKDFEDKIFETFDDNCLVRQNATPELKGLYTSL